MRTLRSSSSTATTTCSRSIRSSSGRARRSSRRCAATSCSGAAPPTTRARCSCTCTGSRRISPPQRRIAPAVTIKLLIEGEEESGSPHFAELLRAHRERAALRRRRGLRHERLQPRHPEPVHRDARHHRLPDRSARPGRGSAQRLVRRRGAKSLAGHGRSAQRAARRRGPGHAARLLRSGAPAG